MALLVDAFQELFLHCLFYWVNAHNNLGNKIFPSFLCSTNDLLDFGAINVLVSSSSSITLKNKKIKNKNKTILLSWGGIEGKRETALNLTAGTLLGIYVGHCAS